MKGPPTRATAKSKNAARGSLPALKPESLVQQALVRQEAQTHTILDTTLDGFAAVNLKGRILDLNQALCRLTGYSREELLTMSIADVDINQSPAEIENRLEMIRSRGVAGVRFETRHRRKDGTEIQVEVSASTPESSGDWICCFVRDITQRRRADFLLRVQRDVAVALSLTTDLQAALDRLLDVVVQLDAVDACAVFLAEARTGDLLMTTHRGGLSRAFIQGTSRLPAASGLGRLIARGQPVYQLYERVPELYDELRVAEGIRTAAVLPLVHESVAVGSLHLGSHTHSAIPEQSCAVAEAIAAQAAGAIVRIRAEAALLESEARLRAIIMRAPVVLFEGDRNGVITFEDGQALQALGMRPRQNVGKRMSEVFRGMPQVVESMQRALAGEEFSTVLEVGPLSVDCWYSPSRDKEGAIVGFTGIGLNVTERRRLERQILEISDREQARIGQDIHDGLCQQLVSLAFDANALQRKLASQALPEAAAAARLSAFLDEAITEARQLSRGLFPIRLQPEGLASALEELAQATARRVSIDCRFTGAQPAVVLSKSTATHLYRVAQEAVSNAVKHARASCISIRLRPEADHIELQVEDDGIGLTAEARRNPIGMGRHIMDYRARAMGATLQILPGSEGGTLVSCCVARRRV